MKVEHYRSQYLKFQALFGLLGYNAAFNFPYQLISLFWLDGSFSIFSPFFFLIFHVLFYLFIGLFGSLQSKYSDFFIKVLLTKYWWPPFIFLGLLWDSTAWFWAALCYASVSSLQGKQSRGRWGKQREVSTQHVVSLSFCFSIWSEESSCKGGGGKTNLWSFVSLTKINAPWYG